MLPDGVEFEEYSSSSEYKQVLRVIAALANQDERIVEQFQVQLLDTDKPEKDKTKVVDFIGYQFAVDPEQLRQQIEVSISGFVGKGNWRTFEEAREYVRTLGFSNQAEFREWAKSKSRPGEIPSTPDRIFKLNCWISWGDFLETDRIANQNKNYIPYKEVKEYVHKLEITSKHDYNKWAKSDKKLENIPAWPSRIYEKQGWISWGDSLETGAIAVFRGIFLPYSEAKNFIQALAFDSVTAFRKWAKSDKKLENIPAWPPRTYEKQGWISWSDFLGVEIIASQNKKYKGYSDAKSFIQKLNLKSGSEYRKWAKLSEKPDDLPVNVEQTYKNNGWIGWGDF